MTVEGDPDDPRRGQLLKRYLAERVPGLPGDLHERRTEPLSDVLTHGQLQVLIFAVQQVAPHVDRQALMSGGSLRDVENWLARTPLERFEGTQVGKPPRGVYRTPSTTLRPLRESDVRPLYEASLAPESTHRWRFRGRTPSFDDFRASLFTPTTLAQYMVVPLDQPDAPIGLVACYNADAVARHSYVAYQRLPTRDVHGSGKGLMVEGALAFIEYLFDHFDFAKLYFELPEYNEQLVAGGVTTFLRKEGELRDHYYYGGRMWSQVIYALYRSEWEAIAPAFRGEWPDRPA